MGAGEDAEGRGFCAELGDTGKGDAGFVLDKAKGGDGFGEIDDFVDGDLADGLEEERQTGGSGGDFGEEIRECDAGGGKGDEGVGAFGCGVSGKFDGGFEVIGLDADDQF